MMMIHASILTAVDGDLLLVVVSPYDLVAEYGGAGPGLVLGRIRVVLVLVVGGGHWWWVRRGCKGCCPRSRSLC
jgi:hypothetical protein